VSKFGFNLGLSKGNNGPRSTELMVKNAAGTDERFRDVNGQPIITVKG